MKKTQKDSTPESTRQKLFAATCTFVSTVLLIIASVSVTACTVWWWDEPQMPDHLQAKCCETLK